MVIDTQTSILPKEVQYAFKNSMTHRVLQFALPIAFRCVLHRFKSQDIHREEFYFIYQNSKFKKLIQLLKNNSFLFDLALILNQIVIQIQK